MRTLKPVLSKRWPSKDMAVLERYGVALRGKALRLSVSGEGGCGCVTVEVPAKSLDHALPLDPNGYGGRQTLHLELETDAASAALAYANAQEALRGRGPACRIGSRGASGR